MSFDPRMCRSPADVCGGLPHVILVLVRCAGRHWTLLVQRRTLHWCSRSCQQTRTKPSEPRVSDSNYSRCVGGGCYLPFDVVDVPNTYISDFNLIESCLGVSQQDLLVFGNNNSNTMCSLVCWGFWSTQHHSSKPGVWLSF